MRESTCKALPRFYLTSSPSPPSFPPPPNNSLGRPPLPTRRTTFDRHHHPVEHLRALVCPKIEPLRLSGRLGRARARQGRRWRGGGSCHCLSPAMLAPAAFDVVDVEFLVSMEEFEKCQRRRCGCGRHRRRGGGACELNCFIRKGIWHEGRLDRSRPASVPAAAGLDTRRCAPPRPPRCRP